jgi:hypothetical protein
MGEDQPGPVEKHSGRGWSSAISEALQLAAKVPAFIAVGLISLLLIGAVFEARADHSLVIAPLSVPTDFPAKGLTGPVLADRLYDRLAALQRGTRSDRAPEALESVASETIKVEIPGTQMSFDDLSRFLHAHLGKRSEVSGEVYRAGDKLVLEARVGDRSTPPRATSEADLDGAITDLADDIFFAAWPYRYAEYLDEQGCHVAATRLAGLLATRGRDEDRAWSYALWSNFLYEDGDLPGALEKADLARAHDPGLEFAYNNAGMTLLLLGRLQTAHDALLRQAKLLEKGGRGRWSQEARSSSLLIAQANAAGIASDHAAAAKYYRAAQDLATSQEDVGAIDLPLATNLALAHSAKDASSVLRSVSERTPDRVLWFQRWHEPFVPPDLELASTLEDWALVLEIVAGYEAALPQGADKAPLPFYKAYDAAILLPFKALAAAKLGDVKTARAWIEAPYDPLCVPCRIARGEVLHALGDPGAESEIQAAVQLSPSLALGHMALARIAHARGDDAQARAEASRAASLQPAWADPKALLAELELKAGQPRKTVEALRSAVPLAPDWSHLQEIRAGALRAIGDRNEAGAALATAQRLRAEETLALKSIRADLAKPERTTLESDDEEEDGPDERDPCTHADARVRGY